MKTTKIYKVKEWFTVLRNKLSQLSFRTGVAVLGLCVLCYALSFSLPFLVEDNWVKGAVWVCFFGLAKTFQYTALGILGIKGWQRVKDWIKRKK